MQESLPKSFLQIIFPLACVLLFSACSMQKEIGRSAKKAVSDSSLQNAHVGITIYDPSTGKYLYNYNGDKYFVPASNTKIPTCYAAMKYLRDSLAGLKYGFSEGPNNILAIQPTGDPTFLHKDYPVQPVWRFLSDNSLRYHDAIGFLDTIWKDERWGAGWSWTDYEESYMAERSSLPIFGNTILIKVTPTVDLRMDSTLGFGNPFRTGTTFFDHILNNQLRLQPGMQSNMTGNEPAVPNLKIAIRRDMDENEFSWVDAPDKFVQAEIPFVTNPIHSAGTAIDIIQDSLKYRFTRLKPTRSDTEFSYTCPDCRARDVVIRKWQIIRSQPTDSMLKPMMHRSDNFFAEQSLLMVSNERLGFMNDEAIIDMLLNTDLKGLPQRPRWADGSGLSRYNLFTPQDFVFILNKMMTEFGMDRVKDILPTGGEGTLSNYYIADKGFIYAKTGSLSGVIALSGFIYTRKNKLLIFSVLVNNHRSSATNVRRTVEKFLKELRTM